MKHSLTRLLAIALIGCLAGTSSVIAKHERPPNVLLICIDDLRTDVGAYGNEMIHTPNLDRLAAEGRVFNRHYVYIAACGPSRSTLLSGKRQKDWDYAAPLRQQLQRDPQMQPPQTPVSLPHAFKQAGYRTVSIGKVSHQPGGCIDKAMTVHELPFSWDRAYAVVDEWGDPDRLMFGYAGGKAYNVVAVPGKNEPRLPYEAGDVDDDGYGDGRNATEAVAQLRELAKGDQPFLLAVGFYRPHLPFNSPKKYWDLYDAQAIPQPQWQQRPRNVDVGYTLHDSYEPTSHYHWPDGRGNISDEQGRTLKHAYWAAISYMDAQVGKVLDAYRELGLEENTIVVLWSDHGWHLGEHGIYGKWTNHDVSLRSPLIIRTPQMHQPGQPTDGIVETIDIYPTLAELCNLPQPDDLQGESIAALVRDPHAPGKAGAIGFVPHGPFHGTTLRTDRYRFVRWIDTRTGETSLLELYDHQSDPNETTNIAAEHPQIVKQLSEQLDALLQTEGGGS